MYVINSLDGNLAASLAFGQYEKSEVSSCRNKPTLFVATQSQCSSVAKATKKQH